MLPKAKRLSSIDVRRILKEGRRTSAPSFSLCIDPKKDKKRYAVAISSKTTTSKVNRNRIKRQVYTSIRSIFNFLRPGEGVVFVLSDISSLSPTELREKIMNLFTKAGMTLPLKKD